MKPEKAHCLAQSILSESGACSSSALSQMMLLVTSS